MIYTHIAAAIFAAAIASAGAWKVQEWRWKAKNQTQAESFAQERDGWTAKVSAAKKATQDQIDSNRRNADAASAQHSATLLSLNEKLKGSNREINRLSDNLSTCKLLPDLVRLLNDQRSAVNASAGKN